MDSCLGAKCEVCGVTYPLSDMYCCPKCATPAETNPMNNTLDVTYNYDEISRRIDKSTIGSRAGNLWRFKELLPVENLDSVVTLSEGGTKLKRCRNLEAYFNIKEIYVKDESTNPTGCHKDREASLLISKAVEWGRKTVSAFTCGNLGASLAAYSAKAGLECVIFIPFLDLQMTSRIAQMVAYGARLYKLSGTEMELENLAGILHSKYHWVLTSLGGAFEYEGKPQSPYIHEAKKTIGLEIVEQLGWRYPDHLITPGAGANFYDSWKAFREVRKLGWAKNDLPKMHSTESVMANPTFEAFRSGRDFVVQKNGVGPTVAYPIASTVSPKRSLSALRESGGSPLCATDEEMLKAQRFLASEEGIFVEPTSASSIAGLEKLVAEGRIDKDEVVVCTVTATGLKCPEALAENMPTIPITKASIDSLKRMCIL